MICDHVYLDYSPDPLLRILESMTRARTYSSNAMESVTLKPHRIENTTPSRLPSTVKSPFIPQAQAIDPLGWLFNANMPSGKGIPRKKPRGNKKNEEMRIRTGIGDARNRPKMKERAARIIRHVVIIPRNGVYHPL
jgi:hypothetical protein